MSANRLFFPEPVPVPTKPLPAFDVAEVRSEAPYSSLIVMIFQQNWENARHIKNERLWFTNTYAIISAGTLTLLQMMKGAFLFETAIIGFMILFSGMGLVSSFRLKAELEECLQRIDHIVVPRGLESITAIIHEGKLPTRSPRFGWIFSWFYGLVSVGFIGLLIFKISTRS